MGTEEDVICFLMDYPNQYFNRNEILANIGGNLNSITRVTGNLANKNHGAGYSMRMYGKLYRVKRIGRGRFDYKYGLIQVKE